MAWFLFRLDGELLRLQRALEDGRWQPAGFEPLFIQHPKPRVIARAPVEDRVVHRAMVALLEPLWERSLVGGDCACRKGKGTHAALRALQGAMRHHRFALHLDVRAYFPSIQPQIVRALVARRVDDAAFMDVLERVLDSSARFYQPQRVREHLGLGPSWPVPGCGLPVGASTSQFLAAHVFLNGLDGYALRSLRVGAWLRYVDDMFVFGRRRCELRAWRAAIGGWLEQKRGLRLKHPQARVLSCAGSLDALGQRVTREGIRPLPVAHRRLRGRVGRAAVTRRWDREAFGRSMASSMGILLG